MIEEDIPRKTQVPKNILESHKMDPYIENLLKKRNKKEHVFDASLLRLHKKARDVFAPLSKVWEIVQACKEGDFDVKDLDMDVMADHLAQTVILAGQSMNAITFHRRRSVL